VALQPFDIRVLIAQRPGFYGSNSPSGQSTKRGAEIENLIEIGIEALMHFRNDTLDLALLLTAYGPGTLENVSFMRDTTNELTVIFRIIKAYVDHIGDQVGKRAAHCIGRGVLDTGVHAIDNYRRRNQSGDTEVAFIEIVCYSITVTIEWYSLRVCRASAKEKCHGAHR